MTISTPIIVFKTLEIVANGNNFTPQYYQITWDTTVATYIQVEVLEGAPFEVALKEGGVYSSRCILQRESLRRGMMTQTIRVRPTQDRKSVV